MWFTIGVGKHSFDLVMMENWKAAPDNKKAYKTILTDLSKAFVII